MGNKNKTIEHIKSTVLFCQQFCAYILPPQINPAVTKKYKYG
jgi:hypothetical protein